MVVYLRFATVAIINHCHAIRKKAQDKATKAEQATEAQGSSNQDYVIQPFLGRVIILTSKIIGCRIIIIGTNNLVKNF